MQLDSQMIETVSQWQSTAITIAVVLFFATLILTVLISLWLKTKFVIAKAIAWIIAGIVSVLIYKLAPGILNEVFKRYVEDQQLVIDKDTQAMVIAYGIVPVALVIELIISIIGFFVCLIIHAVTSSTRRMKGRGARVRSTVISLILSPVVALPASLAWVSFAPAKPGSSLSKFSNITHKLLTFFSGEASGATAAAMLPISEFIAKKDQYKTIFNKPEDQRSKEEQNKISELANSLSFIVNDDLIRKAALNNSKRFVDTEKIKTYSKQALKGAEATIRLKYPDFDTYDPEKQKEVMAQFMAVNAHVILRNKTDENREKEFKVYFDLARVVVPSFSTKAVDDISNWVASILNENEEFKEKVNAKVFGEQLLELAKLTDQQVEEQAFKLEPTDFKNAVQNLSNEQVNSIISKASEFLSPAQQTRVRNVYNRIKNGEITDEQIEEQINKYKDQINSDLLSNFNF